MSFLRPDLDDDGFTGWCTWAKLRAAAFAGIPRTAGTYLVYRRSAAPPRFLEVGTGGRFKGRDPNVPVATLRAKCRLALGHGVG
jgi:hypothetical protein